MKVYGDGAEAEQRRITRPDASSLLVAADAVLLFDGWSLLPGGIIAFDDAPAAGVVLTAGFRFDVPVRFAEDSLTIDPVIWAAGHAGSIPLVEIREG